MPDQPDPSDRTDVALGHGAGLIPSPGGRTGRVACRFAQPRNSTQAPSVAPTPDQLLTAAQSGDVVALGELLRLHQNGIYRYGLKVCRSTEDAEDALQETLWAATRSIQSFRGSAATVVSWMFTMIRRECHRLHHRNRLSEVVPLEDDARCAVPDAESIVASRRDTIFLAAALAALDPIHREVVLLRDIQEFSAPESATLLGISVAATKSRLHRARASLRADMLTRQGRSCEQPAMEDVRQKHSERPPRSRATGRAAVESPEYR